MVVAAYALMLPIGANFNIINDHMFLNTLLSGRFINMAYFVAPAGGRFLPLTGQEYNLVSFFSLSPFAFYIYHAFQLVVVIYLMLKIFKLYIPEWNHGGNLAYGVVLLIIFSPSFVMSWFISFTGERSTLMFFLVFFLSYLLYQKRQKLTYLIAGLIAANIALYYKEPGFLMLGGLGFFHLVLGWKRLNFRQRLFDVLIIISSLIFILAYFFLVFIKMGPVRYGATPYNPVITFAKNIFSYALSEPFITLLLFGLLAYRAYVVLFRKVKPEPIHDSTLLAGMIYVLVFLKLNMFNYHYLLPAYAFATFAMVHFLLSEGYIKKKLCKVLVGITLIIYVTSALPVSMHLISYYKNVPNTFQNTLDFLAKYISREKGRTIIFLDGVDRGGGQEIYLSFAAYLAHRGLGLERVDFKSDIPSRNSMIFYKGDPKNPLTVFRDQATSRVERGDLLIVTPYTTKFSNQEYLDNLIKDYDLLYQAKSTLGIPNVGAKVLIKYYIALHRQRQISEDVIFSNNIFIWPDFYVFRKK